MTLLQEVKSCPFCGCDDIETGLNWINCAKCSAGFNLCDKDTNANIEAWNRRAFADKLEGEEMVQKVARAISTNNFEYGEDIDCENIKDYIEKKWQLHIDDAKAALAVVREMIC